MRTTAEGLKPLKLPDQRFHLFSGSVVLRGVWFYYEVLYLKEWPFS
jgi:hypothetical protein